MPDAIPQDAPAANPAPAAIPTEIPDLNSDTTRLSRGDAYAAMIARRRETVLKEMTPEDGAALVASREPLAPTGGDGDDTNAADQEAERYRRQLEADAAAAPAAPAAQGGQLDRQRAAPVILNDEELPNYMVRTKVLGKEELVPLDRVRSGFQKTESADNYLRQATTLLTDAKQTIRQQQAGGAAAPANAPGVDGQSSPDEDPFAAYHDALFQGDQERANELLRKATGRGNATPGPAADELARAVEQRIVIRSALRQFAQDHKSIVLDPTLRAKADEFLMEATGGLPLEQLEPDRVAEVVNEAGARTQEWLREKAGVSTAANPTATDSRNERRAQKAKIDEPPVAAARRATSVAPPMSTSERIAAMGAARPGSARSGPG